MRVFIIRPFAVKEDIDFDRVERELIQPALAQLGHHDLQVSGSTTALITRQGNIREDMFRLIAVSDLVIADISIHNANVYYELGMRHALKPRHTVMIRSKTKHPHPFDLQTDRYFTYDAANPAASVPGLVTALGSSLASEGPDSPMFTLLPQLGAHGRGQLVTVPNGFREEVQLAHNMQEYGKLRLLALEAGAFAWDQEGLRMVGDAQFKLRALPGARDTFELLRQTDGLHVHANLRLGTIYQRLALRVPAERKPEQMTLSAQAIKRVLSAKPTLADQVEAHCLLGSNEKSRWLDELADLPPAQKQEVTLQSGHFDAMLKEYLLATNLDLNAHYPAINALAGLKIRRACALALPAQWEQLHEDKDSATRAMDAIDKLIGHLASTLHLALELNDLMGKRPGQPDPWAGPSRADYLLLTACDNAARVAQAYRSALKDSDWFTLEATRRNLDIYRTLGLFEPGLGAALAQIDALAAGGKPPAAPGKLLMFTGHMVDAAGKPAGQARFPNTPEAIERARGLIREAVQAELASAHGEVLGLAGGACGGDILFHEVCAELGVRTQLYLAFPPDRFIVSSVQRGGPRWVERFGALVRRLAPHVLQPAEALPAWLVDKPDYSVWERNNLWMMFSAMSSGADELTLLALYNAEREAEGPGGTGHLLGEAGRRGFKALELDARVLLAQ